MTNNYKTKLPNSQMKLQERLKAGNISGTWPVIIVFTRFILAVVAQTLVAGLYMLFGNPTPWQAAAPWWIVYGTLIDIGCLVLLAKLAHREGIHLFDLIGFQQQHLGRDLILGVGFTLLFIVLAVIGGIVAGVLIYGENPIPVIMSPLPVGGTLYALFVWPLIWAIAEEMTYQGYALPRIEILSKRPWLGILIVGFGWAFQHCALPLMLDWHFVVYRFGSSLLIGITLPIIYLRIRRLVPFIIAHWAANFVSVLMTVALPLMMF